MVAARSKSPSSPLLRVVDVVTTRTHCPYCAFQCGMTVTATSRRARPRYAPAGGQGRPGLPGQPRPDVHQGLHLGRPARPPGARSRARCCASATGGSSPVTLGRGARLRRRAPDPASAQRHGAAALAAFGSGALTNEKAYLLGKFVRVALRLAEHRLQRPLLHVVGGGGPEPRVRHRPRAAVPGQRHRRDRRR